MLHFIDVNALFSSGVFRLPQTASGVYGTRSLRIYAVDIISNKQTTVFPVVDSAFLIIEERKKLFKLVILVSFHPGFSD